MSQKLLLILACTLLLLSGCNIIYKQNIQQGNAIEQDKLDQLKIGMTMNQVAFLLGTPAVRDPFHQQRWDYYYSLSLRGKEPAVRVVTLKFNNSILDEVVGVDFDDQKAVMRKETTDPVEIISEETVTEEPVTDIVAAEEPVLIVVDPEESDIIKDVETTQIHAVDTPDASSTSMPETPAPISENAPAPENASPPETDTAASTDQTSMWIVQLGAFDSQVNADNLLARMNENGFQGEILLQKTAHLQIGFW